MRRKNMLSTRRSFMQTCLVRIGERGSRSKPNKVSPFYFCHCDCRKLMTSVMFWCIDHDGAREIRLVISRTGSPSRTTPTHKHVGPVLENAKLYSNNFLMQKHVFANKYRLSRFDEAPIKRVEIIAKFIFKYRDFSKHCFILRMAW